jgi:hypothetical protein
MTLLFSLSNIAAAIPERILIEEEQQEEEEESIEDEDLHLDAEIQEVLDLYTPRALAASIPAALASSSSAPTKPKQKRRGSSCSNCDDPDCKGGITNGTCKELKSLPSRCANCRTIECYSDRISTTPVSKCPKCKRCKDLGCRERPCVVDLENSEFYKEHILLVKSLSEKEKERRRAKRRKSKTVE